MNVVRLPGQDVALPKSQINNLQAGGNTSIMLGMKWGMALLDPGTRGIFSALIAESAIPATLAGRPFAYADPDALKVIVLMTDGEHVAHSRITDPYKTGASPIYQSTGDGNYSIFHAAVAGANKYWVPHRSEWHVAAWNSGGGVVQQNWEQVWTNLRIGFARIGHGAADHRDRGGDDL